MAQIVDFNKFSATKSAGYTFIRSNPIPVDKTSYYGALSAATAYAASDPVAYIGQVVSVFEDGKVDVYKIVSGGTLEKIGAGAGSLSAETYSIALGMAAAETATLGQLIYVTTSEEVSGTTYNAGSYVVAGIGAAASLQYLTSEAAGSSGFTGRVTALETSMGKVQSDLAEVKKWPASGITTANIEQWNKAEENVQSDWNETDDTKDSFIKNKPEALANSADVQTAKDEAKGYASAYTEDKITELDLPNTYETKGAAYSALTEAKSYTDEQIASESARSENAYDVKGASELAKAYASSYTDNKIAELDDKYEIKGAAESALTEAKSYTDELSGNVVSAITKVKEESVVTVEKLENPEASAFCATYVVKQNGAQVGASINIPKDYLVKKAEVKTCTEDDKPVIGYRIGDKYIDFTVNTLDSEGQESHIYLKVTELVDVYTAGNYIEITSGNVISVNYTDLKAQLKSDFAIDDLATKEYVNTLSANVETAIEEVKNDIDALSGNVHTAILSVDGKVNTLSGVVETVEERLVTAEGDIDALQEKVGDSAVSAQIINAINAYSANVETALDKKVDAEDGKSLVDDAQIVKLEGIESGAQVNVIEQINVNGIDGTIADKKASVEIEGKDIKVGKDITDGTDTISATTKVDVVLQGIYDRLNGIQSSALTEVVADESGITVTEKNHISLKLETATTDTVKDGHIELKVNDNGQLYGQMYYIEGDSE